MGKVIVTLLIVALCLTGCGSFQPYIGDVPLNASMSSQDDLTLVLAIVGVVVSSVLLGVVVGNS